MGKNSQIVMAKFFRNGDIRSGYYRDQTFYAGNWKELTVKQFFAGLYAHTNIEKEPPPLEDKWGGHFSTKFINEDEKVVGLSKSKKLTSDISPTAAQMPRLVCLGLASKMYRNNKELSHLTNFSNNGNEIAFGTIGDASTSEGIFWESINAACVLEIPVVMSVWDDGYGISVPKNIRLQRKVYLKH